MPPGSSRPRVSPAPLAGANFRSLSGPADLGKRLATRYELAEKGKKKGFAEPPNGWSGLKVKGAADDIAVEFI